MKKRFVFLMLCIVMLLPIFASCDGGETESSNTSSDVSVEESKEESILEDVSFVVTSENKDKLKIYCPKTVSAKARAAANDLRTHIRKMTGWNVPLVADLLDESGILYIAVGESEVTERLGYKNEHGYPGKESVTVSQKGNFVVLMGNDDGNFNGTQFAVTALLEKLGCGWFADDPLWTVIPELETLDLNVGDVYLNFIPRFSTRTTRVNSAAPTIAARWYQGGQKNLTGHWLYQVVPASEYSEHPEWFALVGDKRDPSGITYWHFCYSNKEFADRIADEAIKKFNDNPELISLTIAANDGWSDDWCECDNCSSLGNVSDVMVHFANNVAEKVSKVHPDRLLQIYSYHNTFHPPVNSVKLHQNVELMLCRETNMYKPLDEDFMMPTGKDPISQIYFTQSWRQNALEYIEKTQPTHVSIWDWYCIAAGKQTWQNVPWVQGEVAIRNQKLYEELGAEYVYYDHGPTDGYFEPNTVETFVLRWPLWYVAAKASFDGSLDEKEILGDACDKLFGDASELMLQYFVKMSDVSKECNAYCNTWVPCEVGEMYTKPKADAIKALVKEILEKAESCSEDEQARINMQLNYWIKKLG